MNIKIDEYGLVMGSEWFHIELNWLFILSVVIVVSAIKAIQYGRKINWDFL